MIKKDVYRPFEQEQNGTVASNKCLFFSKTSGITWTGRQHKIKDASLTASARFSVALTLSFRRIVG
jgi:hypothetical protein